ncbi:GNAT family N-acetyltransferase [Paenibacillus sp. GD4]|uniref:GNAT family N-acetyltransferase n=1 Tax=Paenibacillus sp. GD4 TaxID=3068890 RepID=UPI002796969F|nr:GNAT family N-acetyltransferase [Paenibacillus sp. GD4]MDQ1911912.1 GNAT family N-acetyltransferase [Paenibacillus sp. GD4]
MLRKRIPRQDDGTIFHLVNRLLVPFAREAKPNLSFTISTLRNRLKHCSTYVQTAPSRAVIGFISLRSGRDILLVDMLAVDPRYQGRGIGGTLLKQAERVALRTGSRSVGLWVDESNRKAQNFYQAKGFSAVQYEPRIRCYFLIKDIR